VGVGTNRYPETNTAVRKRKPQATDHATAGHAVVAPHAVLLARDGHSCPIRDIVSDGTFVAAVTHVTGIDRPVGYGQRHEGGGAAVELPSA